MTDGATATSPVRQAIRGFLGDYGIVLALVVLCTFFSLATFRDQQPEGAAAGKQLAESVAPRLTPGARVLVVVAAGPDDAALAEALRVRLARITGVGVTVLSGGPAETREELDRLSAGKASAAALVLSRATAPWPLWDGAQNRFPALRGAVVAVPSRYRGSVFLKPENLLNIANQIAVIAILAIGMTLVIITGGIDLSVGSLIALSAVITARLIRDVGGAQQASGAAMLLACLVGIAGCGAVGLFTGLMITRFRIPAFIVTLAMMLVTSGLAFILAGGESVYRLPESFVTLGRGSAVGLPIAVWLTLALYATAHLLMTRTGGGRAVYAVGSNAEAARLSGIPIQRVLCIVYTLSAALAGLGGVVMASQLNSGSPTYGQMYELFVIAAVVVGGASLSGGRGKAFGTLLGALVIAVIRNGMNLMGVQSYTQTVILGLVILGAVMLDQVRQRDTA